MRNRLDERPTREVHAGSAYALSFVARDDVAERDVLDVGCGFGWFELAALDLDCRSIVGVEPTRTDLATAERHVDDERASFCVADARALPFDDGSFDTVVMWEVIEHLPRGTEPAALTEIARVLRPGGVLYLSTPFASTVSTVLDPAWWLIGHRHYRVEILAALLRDAGLALEQHEVRGGLWTLLYINNLYVAKWIFRRRPFFECRLLRLVDREWRRDRGLANIFVRGRKPLQAWS
ncbi:MAG: class I SAM-dependent methyltransferase [Thermoleophilia bacterium]|nr:class I SAM-dependent methyltransferase [Thermoleophilia bacterium]